MHAMRVSKVVFEKRSRSIMLLSISKTFIAVFAMNHNG